MAALRYSQRFFRSAHHLSESERHALARTVRAMRDADVLPSEGDVQTLMPPSQPVWRRRVGDSDRYLYFVIAADGAAVFVAVGGFL